MGPRLVIPLRYGMPWGGDWLFHFATACLGAEIDYSTSLRHAMGRRLIIPLRYGITWARRLIFPLRYGMQWGGDWFFHFATPSYGQRSVTSTLLRCIIYKPPCQTFYGVRIFCAVPINGWRFAQTTLLQSVSVISAD